MLTDSVSGEGSLPGLQTVTFSLCLHTAFSFFSVGSEQELCDIASSSYKDTLLLDYTSMLMMSFNLN